MTLDIRGQERLAALLIVGAIAGLCHWWSDTRNSTGTPEPRDARIPSPSATLSAIPSASALPDEQEQIAVFCDLQHDAAAQLSPTSVSSKSETRTNPFTRKAVTVRPRNLTPEQRDAARKVIEHARRATIRKGCDLVELAEGSRLVMVGLDTSCERSCRFNARQLDPRTAKFILKLAIAASMTIDVDDHVYIPLGVKSEHAGESYATTVSTPEELAKVASRFVGGWFQYRGRPSQGDVTVAAEPPTR